MKLTLGQAAKECGRSKSTLSKAIKSGKMSVSGQSSAGYEIDPAELFRVFPKNGEGANDPNDRTPSENGLSNAERSALDQQIALLRQTLEDLRADRDEWRKQAQTLALSHEKETKPAEGLWSAIVARVRGSAA